MIKFHQYTTKKLVVIRAHVINYIIDHEEGGAAIYTNIPTSNSDKYKSFRTLETTQEIYDSYKIKEQLLDGIFSNW